MSPKWVITFLALALVALAIALGATAANAGTNNYSRPDIILIQTRRNGDWKVRCHNLHQFPNGSDTIYAFGGCLPPYHIIKK